MTIQHAAIPTASISPALVAAALDCLAFMPKVDVITGEKRHRRWTIEEKQTVVGAAFAPGVRPTDIAKRAVISTGRPCSARSA